MYNEAVAFVALLFQYYLECHCRGEVLQASHQNIRIILIYVYIPLHFLQLSIAATCE